MTQTGSKSCVLFLHTNSLVSQLSLRTLLLTWAQNQKVIHFLCAVKRQEQSDRNLSWSSSTVCPFRWWVDRLCNSSLFTDLTGLHSSCVVTKEPRNATHVLSKTSVIIVERLLVTWSQPGKVNTAIRRKKGENRIPRNRCIKTQCLFFSPDVYTSCVCVCMAE